MKIVKDLILNKSMDNGSLKRYYAVTITIENNERLYSAFIKTDGICEPDSIWININNLNNEKFLKDHGIEYIIEGEHKNIIPIGLIDFMDKYNYSYSELNVWNQDGVNLHKANQILKNIDRAIQIKYEAIKFIERLGESDKYKREEIEL